MRFGFVVGDDASTWINGKNLLVVVNGHELGQCPGIGKVAGRIGITGTLQAVTKLET